MNWNVIQINWIDNIGEEFKVSSKLIKIWYLFTSKFIQINWLDSHLRNLTKIWN